MLKNLNITQNARRLMAISMVAVSLTALPGCGSIDNSNLTTRVVALSEADSSILADDYIKAICNREDTSIKDLERGFEDAYLAGKNGDCNDYLERIITIELKALTAEGLGIDESDMEDFKVTGHYLVPGLFDDRNKEESYGVYFKYRGHEYNIKANDNEAIDACFCARAALQNQLSLTNIGSYDKAYALCKNLLTRKFVFKEKTITRDLIASEYGSGDVSHKIIYMGTFNLDKDKVKTKVMK